MKTALIIVAHPDDETIWMSGTILRNRKTQWTIMSMCRKNDLDRQPKFIKACDYYKASPIISDLDDEKLKPLKIKEVMTKIMENLTTTKFDFVYTHGENGEYGHIRHCEIHDSVRELIKSGEIQCEKLLFFSYDRIDDGIPFSVDAEVSVELNKKELEEKKMIIRDVYGFDENSFEFLSCGEKESFVLSK